MSFTGHVPVQILIKTEKLNSSPENNSASIDSNEVLNEARGVELPLRPDRGVQSV